MTKIPDDPQDDSTTTLAQIKATIAAYRAERGWDNLDPRDLAISIVLEASELLEHFQWSNDIDIEANRQKIIDEFADTFNYLMQFAMTLGFDVTAAWHGKLERVKAKYPTSVFSPDKKFDGNAYHKIKQAYRGKNAENEHA